MTEKLAPIIEKIIWFSHLGLATITPLIFSTQNTELFEVPKMFFVYILTTLILFATLTKFALEGKIIVPKSPILITFLALLAITTLSTLTSIDKFTSVFGYPSRLNGGLLSQFAYFVIFVCAIINLDRQKAKKLTLAIVGGALIVALWGIPSHFGFDPSCFVLVGKFTSSCWQSDFNPLLRIFSTLGQPNWLASYLVLTLPTVLGLIFTFQKQSAKIFFFVSANIIFTAFILTNSQSGAAGMIVAIIIFFALLGIKNLKNNLKLSATLIASVAILTVIFGTTLTSRIQDAASSQKKLPATSNQVPGITSSTPTSGGTESSQIRLIVWKGAMQIAKRWPVLGSGPETFAYSYYLYRPQEHNKTSEWGFFYNKAHNEFLNYLANTGVLGLAAYLALLVTIFISLFRASRASLTAKSAIAGILGYLVTIFFGFTTVATQTIMFILIGIALVSSPNALWKIELNLKLTKIQKPLVILVLVIGFFALTYPLRLYLSDVFFERAKSSSIQSRQINAFKNAISTYPTQNPFYLSQYALALAQNLGDEADEEILMQIDANAQEAEKLAPNNVIVVRKVANTYLLLSDFDDAYYQKALATKGKLSTLAPNDPQTHLTKAKIEVGLGLDEEARQTLAKVLELKPDYLEARQLLDQVNLTIDQ